MTRSISLALTALALLLAPARASAQNASAPGALGSPHPTTQSLSLEWEMGGDANLDGAVSVRYRPQGTGSWKVGPPLVHVPAGSNSTGSFGSGNGQWSHKHSGSLFDLTPGTSYEVELTLTDPDGGGVTRTLTATTRPIPVAPTSNTSKTVTPATFAAALAAAAPGQTLLLSPGTYAPFSLEVSGAAGAPLVLRGSAASEVIFSGRIDLLNLHHVYLERVTVQGEVRMNGSSNMVVRECRIRTTAGGITFEQGSATPEDNYIVDNDVVGGAVWEDSQLSVSGYNGGEGIQFTGPGHEVCFNHVANFRDDISLMEYDEAFDQRSIDICHNDIEQATDDAVEADSAMGNVRVRFNRVKNCFDGLSSQPNLGGPTYFVGNTLFNVLYTPFKFHNGTVGDQVFHNTVVKNGDAFGCYAGATWSRAVFRNNLMLGGPGGTWGGYSNGTGKVLDLADADSSCSFDFDGLGSTTGTFTGRTGATKFTSLSTLRSSTTEVHATQVDLGVFAATVTFPSSAFPAQADPDLRLAPDGGAVDRGVILLGINDGYAGQAPDLGALELGAEVPTYGPRTGGTGGGGASTGGGSGSTGGGTVSTGGGASGLGGGAGGAGEDAGTSSDGGALAGASGQCGCTTGDGARLGGATVCLVALLRRRLKRPSRALRRREPGPAASARLD